MIVPIPLLLARSNPRVLVRFEIAWPEIHSELGGVNSARAEVDYMWHLSVVHFSFITFVSLYQ